MRTMKLAALLLAAVLLLAGCGGKNEKTDAPKEAPAASAPSAEPAAAKPEASAEGDGWYFEKDGVKVYMNVPAEPVIKALGEYKNSYEAPSCAFDGMDVVYSYPGFEILTYEKGGEATVSGVVLRDDTVETAEGLFIGSDQAAVENAYGKLADGANNLRVTKGSCELLIILTDGYVSSIQYIALAD